VSKLRRGVRTSAASSSSDIARDRRARATRASASLRRARGARRRTRVCD
jgi:hypothetical protein